jgi:hypothetical protein
MKGHTYFYFVSKEDEIKILVINAKQKNCGAAC